MHRLHRFLSRRSCWTGGGTGASPEWSPSSYHRQRTDISHRSTRIRYYARTLEIYNSLGVLPDIMAASAPPPLICDYKLPGGTEIAEVYHILPHNRPTPDRPHLNPCTLSQNLNEAILRSHLSRYGTQVELGTELHGFEDKGDHIVASIVKKGPDGSEHTEYYNASYLVGADGAKGIVRKRLGMTFDGEAYDGLNMVFSDIRIRGLDHRHWHKWGEMTEAMILLRYTEEGDRFWLLAGGKAMDTTNLRGEPESMKQWIAALTGRHDIEVMEVLTFTNYKPQMRMVKDFSKGRVYLAGDAAHVHSPAAAQGMNNGISDAFNLAWRLALAYRSLASTDLMSSYTQERAPIIKTMLHRTTALMNENSTTFGKFASKMGRQDRLPVFQLDLHYRWSPVVLEDPPSSKAAGSGGHSAPDDVEPVHAGNRAPDAPGIVELRNGDNSVKTLFHYFKPTHHTALIFTSSKVAAIAFVSALERIPADVVRSALVLPRTASVRMDNVDSEFDWISKVDYPLKDCEGQAYDIYSVALYGGDVAVIVRPDGMIGAIVKDGEGVAKYFQRILTA
ncbi:hypothetical protein OE88DRAFT_584720 [Heliocybe sulcata]|uniref:FAD-binding domain-containing protein n=1 Tax=Heliocybe sulcata TaxID=5364 RepID=A0A5C3MU30_9AGAM|nr:hypothetical protein OE88DRAFT_584720 [Heliocybe sulcata]